MKTEHERIRIALVGVGNCASSLVQGIHYYRKRPNEATGLTFRTIHGWDVSDIEVVAAFDIDQRKIRRPLKDAIFAQPNVTSIFEPDIPDNGVRVTASPVLDGVPGHMYALPPNQRFQPANDLEKTTMSDIVRCLQAASPEFVICYLPVGASAAASFYAECALAAGVSFINAVPVFIASDPTWISRFVEQKLVVLGDDIKSQAGSTILHRILVHALSLRGVVLKCSYQLNIGGNTDFLNMLDDSRVTLKRQSKLESVRSQCQNSDFAIHAGPSDYVPHLKDNKIAYINITGSGFGNLPVELEVKLSVEDSTNSAGVMVDIIRIAHIARLRGAHGALTQLSAYGFKHPLEQYSDSELFEWFQEWVKNGTQ